MRFVLDECCDYRLALALKSAGHDVIHAADVSPAAPDDTVWDIAVGESRILVTNDNDFGLLYRRRRPSPAAILLLRLDRLPPVVRIERAIAVVEALGEQIEGFVVVEPGLVRRSVEPGE